MGFITTTPGGALAYNGASGGKIYGYNNISESGLVQVAAANTSRVKLTFHNPGANDIFIAPVQIQTTGSNVAFNPSNAALVVAFAFTVMAGSLQSKANAKAPIKHSL